MILLLILFASAGIAEELVDLIRDARHRSSDMTVVTKSRERSGGRKSIEITTRGALIESARCKVYELVDGKKPERWIGSTNQYREISIDLKHVKGDKSSELSFDLEAEQVSRCVVEIQFTESASVDACFVLINEILK